MSGEESASNPISLGPQRTLRMKPQEQAGMYNDIAPPFIIG